LVPVYDEQATGGKQEQPFMDMMHDFIETHRDAPASTESFKTVVEKHMTKRMDLQLNGRLDWFLAEWVYGTDIPRYQFQYDVQPGDKGGFKARAQITQSEVDEHLAMLVPVFADFGNGMIRPGQVEMIGNSTQRLVFDMDRQPKKVALNAYKDVLER
jgi:aminopeptidase N